MTSSSSIQGMIAEKDAVAGAIFRQDPSSLKALLSPSRTVNYRIPYTASTPLLLAIGPSPQHTEIVKLLLQYQADVSLPESVHSITPLMAACNTGNEEVVELLLQAGAAVNAQSADGKTALIQMARQGNLKFLRKLLKSGADETIYDEQAKNALMYACSENRLEIAHYLLNNTRIGVNEYKVDTPLWHACASGNAEIVLLLIAHGAHIEYRLDGTIYSTTPLMEACEWGHFQVVQILLQRGADVTSRTGRKALMLAKQSGYHKVVRLMESWKRRLQHLERLADNQSSEEQDFSATLLPDILSLTGFRPDLTHRLVRQCADQLSTCK